MAQSSGRAVQTTSCGSSRKKSQIEISLPSRAYNEKQGQRHKQKTQELNHEIKSKERPEKHRAFKV
jgi:hypothetical protein